MSITPLTLTGVSQYSSDYQNILNRAVQIAQIPVTALQNKDSDIQQQTALLGVLNTAVSGLASSLQTLGTDAASGALGATSSDSSVVTVANAGATTPTSYTINSVTSTATAAAERSLTGYADSSSTPVSSTGTVQLVVGSKAYNIDLTGSGGNNLLNLENQINNLGAGVTASILTTGNGNYLSLTANDTGATTLKLVDDPTGAAKNLLTSNNQGADAVFQLNGITIDQASNTVNSVIPGMVFTLQQASATPVTLSLAPNAGQISNDLSSFVTNYNSLVSEVQAQEGSSGGLLSGDTTVTGLQNLMRQLTSFTRSSGSVQSLADLGITFADGTGQATFDPTVVSNMSGSQLSDAMSFIGSATSGLGGFSQSFTQYSDPINGLIQTETTGLTSSDTQIKNQIATLTARINTMQTSLSQQLAAADAQQAELQSQQSQVAASIQGLNLVLYGPNPTA